MVTSRDNLSAKDLVLDYVRHRRDGEVAALVNGEVVLIKVTPAKVSKWAMVNNLHNRPFTGPVQRKIMDFLDYLCEEPWLCNAQNIKTEAKIGVQLGSANTTISYFFTFRQNGGKIEIPETGISDDSTTDTVNVNTPSGS
jgi:hypothetical protein